MDLLGRCNEIGTMGGFIEITLNDEDLDAGPNVFIFSCEKVPKTKQGFDLTSTAKRLSASTVAVQ